MIEFILGGIGVAWAGGLTYILTPDGIVKDTISRVTRGKWDINHPLKMIAENIESNPDHWLIDEERARFPIEGSAQISFMKDRSNGWEYSITSTGRGSTKLRGYYGERIKSIIAKEAQKREAQAIYRQFYDFEQRLLK